MSIFEKNKVKAWWEYNKSLILMRISYDWKDIPEINDGMSCTQLLWRKAVVAKRNQWVMSAEAGLKKSLQLVSDAIQLAKLRWSSHKSKAM